MAEKYEWCRDITETVIVRPSYKKYCFFHLPKENLNDSLLESFNKRVFTKISEAMEENGSCDLSGTIFKGDISFEQFSLSNPLPAINFSKTIFYGETDFSGVIFNGDVNFNEATFIKTVNFVAAYFKRTVDFSDTKFRDETFFKGSSFDDIANFNKTLFNKNVFFLYCPKFIVNFVQVSFIEGAMFFGQEFKEGSIFASLTIKEKLFFQYVDFSKVSFFNVDFKMMEFSNCNWITKKGRDILYDEPEVLKDFKYGYFGVLVNEYKKLRQGDETILSLIKKTNIRYKSIQGRINSVQSLYRALKRKYKEEHNEYEVSNWHYGEKEMFRKGSFWRRSLPSISTLYWFSSGYGERPVRAGLMLIVLIPGLTLLLNFFGIEANQINNDNLKIIQGFSGNFDLKRFGLLIFTTFQYILFVKVPDYVPYTYFGNIIVLFFSKLIIPLQAALFALAVRNRFRR